MDNRNLMKTNRDECQVLNLGRRATGTNTGWGPMSLGTALLKIQAPEALVYSKLYMSQQYAMVAKKAKKVLGCVNKTQPVAQGK